MPQMPVTISTALMCPHGGTVTLASSNARISARGELLLLASDICPIAACVNQPPCDQVLWTQNPRVIAGGQPTVWFGQAPPGTCLAAGVPQGPVTVIPVPKSVSEV